MNPFNLLLAMYAGFALLLFAAGYIYKSLRDRRNRGIAPTFDFERRIGSKPEKEKAPPVAVTR